MFCPNCGKSDQTPDSYCRSCGEFLTDYSAKAYLLNRLLGGSSPRTQVRLNLVINVVTFLASAFLLGVLKGHYDAVFDKTGASPPGIIYLVYIFLGLVTTWQVLGFVINRKLLKKLGAGRRGAPGREPAADEDALSPRATRRTLPGGGLGGDAAGGATEHTTRSLEEVPRRRPTSRDLR